MRVEDATLFILVFLIVIVRLVVLSRLVWLVCSSVL